MARQPDIQYIRFYTAGSAARKVEVAPQPQKQVQLPRPKVRRQRRRVIRIDPIALAAVVVAVFMLIAMAIGVAELIAVNARSERMESYAAQLQSENNQLRDTYEAGYDLADIEEKALAMGMVPSSQVQHVTVRVEPIQPPPAPTFWEELGAMFRELFA